MLRHLFVFFFICTWFSGSAQCPLVLNTFGTYTDTPRFINCNGNIFNLNFQSNSSFSSYTISWGDGGPNTTGASYAANTIITHTYAATTNTYAFSLTTGTCTINGLVVQEQAALASIVLPNGVNSTLCAPKTLTFTNGTTFTSATTSYTWSFGDNLNSQALHSYTNAGQDVTFTYNKGSVNCATQVTLMAQNYCNFTPSSASFGPLQVYDTDIAALAADRPVRCWPDNQFTFTNTTNRNCLPQGNTAQRYEKWNFGNFWGKGTDSIKDWSPWPPTMPVALAYTNTGTYKVTVLDSNMCGISTATMNVTILSAPVASVTGPSTNICVNTPVTFTNSNTGGTQHRWNFGTGGGFVNLGGGNKTFTYTTPGTYTVKLVIFITGGGNACTDTAQTVVNVVGIPTASFAMAPNSGCNTLTTTFTDQSTGAVSWNWNFGNGNTSALQIPSPETYTAAGIYTVSLAVTNTNNCTNAFSNTVIVRQKPAPSFVQFSACEDLPVTFTNTSAPGANAITGYTWFPANGGAVSNVTNPTFSYNSPGTYSVKLIAETAFCRDSTIRTVTINIVPTASFVAAPVSGCPNLSVNFSNLSQNATAFFWRLGAGATSTSNATGTSFVYSNSTQSFQNYSITLISSTTEGCSDSITKVIAVSPKPVAAFTVNTITGCSPKVTTFTNTSIGATSSSWSFGDGGFSAATSPSHTYSNSSLFTQTVVAQLIVTNNSGCGDTASALITVYPEALTSFSMIPSSGCSRLPVTFPAVPGVATYTWSYGDGTPGSNLSAHIHTFTNNSLTDKLFTVTLTAQTSNGCSGTGTGTVLVRYNPVAQFTFTPSTGCSPLPVTFTNSSAGNPNSVKWDLGNGTTSLLNNASATYTNGPGSANTTFNVKLVVSTPNCSDSLIRQVSVLPRPVAAFTPDTPACAPKLMSMKNISQGATTFRWNFGDGGTSNQESPPHLFVNTTKNDAVYNVKLVSVNGQLCKDSVTVPVTIHPKPEFFISSRPDSGCSPLRVTFHNIPGVEKYQWKYDDIGFGNAGNISSTFENKLTGNKSFSIQLVASDKFGCSDTSGKKITVYPLPVSRFSAKPLSVFIPKEPVNFTNESSSSATSFTWSFGDGNVSKIKSPSHFYTSKGEYQVVLVAASKLGCRDTFALPEIITAIEETTLEMPNAFTPNAAGSPGTIFDPNDTSNDIFHPNVKGTEKYTFSVYSRWGELLFETRNPDEGWDGYYKGRLCGQDVYVWKISATFIDGKTYNKSGDFLLLK